ncbi:MAG: hypothetical protein ABI119_03345 [Gemmatimonadaceae bacterium]
MSFDESKHPRGRGGKFASKGGGGGSASHEAMMAAGRRFGVSHSTIPHAYNRYHQAQQAHARLLQAGARKVSAAQFNASADRVNALHKEYKAAGGDSLGGPTVITADGVYKNATGSLHLFGSRKAHNKIGSSGRVHHPKHHRGA